MKAIIIGGGKIGYHLLLTLRERGCEVTLVEKDMALCERIAEEAGTDVICGDGTDLGVLRQAGIARADVVAAVTGKDEENLVVCQIAKAGFGTGKSIARINNPKNIPMFRALGVDQTVCSTQVIADLIEFEFDKNICRIVQTFERGSMLLVEARIDEGSPWLGSFVRDLTLPQDCVLASVLRAERVIYTRGDTQLCLGDAVLIVADREAFKEIKKALHSGGKHHAKNES